MPLRTSPTVHRTTSKLLDQMHRDRVMRLRTEPETTRQLPRMRPYADQLAYERGTI